MGGVIQIFTRKGHGSARYRVATEGGSYQSGKAALSTSGSVAGFGYAVTLDGQSTKGISAAANAAELDPYRRVTEGIHLTSPLADGDVELIWRNTNGRTSLDGFGPVDRFNYNSTARQTVTGIKASLPLADELESSLQLSRSTDVTTTSDPASTFNNSDFRTDIDQLSWLNQASISELTLLGGVEWRRQFAD